jgi:hypothetical protein
MARPYKPKTHTPISLCDMKVVKVLEAIDVISPVTGTPARRRIVICQCDDE